MQLQQDDAQHVQEIARATEGALERWESGDGSLPQAPEDPRWLSSELGVDGADVIEVLGELRDTDRDSEADRIIEYAALNASPIAVGALYALLDHHGRRLDADRFVDAIARHCSSVRLRKLAVDVKVPRPLFVFPGTESPGQKIGLQQEQRPFGEVLLPTVGSRTPTDVLVALVRSFRERNETGCLKSLAAPRRGDRVRNVENCAKPACLPPAGCTGEPHAVDRRSRIRRERRHQGSLDQPRGVRVLERRVPACLLMEWNADGAPWPGPTGDHLHWTQICAGSAGWW